MILQNRYYFNFLLHMFRVLKMADFECFAIGMLIVMVNQYRITKKNIKSLPFFILIYKFNILISLR